MHNTPADEVFIIGHKNPDTDSICSAIAYANLKNLTENKYFPKRAGKLNKETEYVLKRFGVKTPELLSDVDSQVKDITYRLVDGVSGDITLKKAFELMQENDATTLPVVDDGKIKGLVTVGDIAEAYFLTNDSDVLYRAGTTCKDVIDTIHGEILVGDENAVVPSGKVMIGAAHVDVMKQYIKPHDIIILGDREKPQHTAIENGAGRLIVCLVDCVSDKVLEEAKAAGCTVIISRYDTYTVARLIGQSMPIKHFMIKDNIYTFREEDTIETLKGVMSKTRYRYFPVVNKYGMYKGLVSRRNFINSRKKQIILVDHNERSQSVDNIDKAEILEIIDHHRIGSVETVAPVYFRNLPLGCTATIIYMMYKEQNIFPDRATAGLMCAAILSDTLMFKSPTCTPVDELYAKELAGIAEVDLKELAMSMFTAGSNLTGKTTEEILHQDYKKFDVGDKVVGIGQITSISKDELSGITAKMKKYMKDTEFADCDICLFIMTDILDEGSGVLCKGSIAKQLCQVAFGKSFDDNYAYVEGLVSRKKQVVPELIRAMEKL